MPDSAIGLMRYFMSISVEKGLFFKPTVRRMSSVLL